MFDPALENPPPLTVGAEPSPGRQRVGAAPPPAPVPRALEGQTRWTLLFLAAIAFVCLAAWGSAKVACNYHPVHSERFKIAPLEKRATSPKDTALAFHHASFIQDWGVASELSSGEGRTLLEARQAACDAVCESEQPDRVARAATRAILYRTRGASAWAKVETFYADRVDADSYELQRVDGRWRVVGRSEPPPLPPPGVVPLPGAPPLPGAQHSFSAPH